MLTQTDKHTRCSYFSHSYTFCYSAECAYALNCILYTNPDRKLSRIHLWHTSSTPEDGFTAQYIVAHYIHNILTVFIIRNLHIYAEKKCGKFSYDMKVRINIFSHQIFNQSNYIFFSRLENQRGWKVDFFLERKEKIQLPMGHGQATHEDAFLIAG